MTGARLRGRDERRLVGVVTVAVLLALSGCGDSGDDRATLRPPASAADSGDSQGGDRSDSPNEPDGAVGGADTAADSTTATEDDGGDGPRLVEEACTLGVLPTGVGKPTCGWVEVPARRDIAAESDGARMRLRVARFHSTADAPGDPLIYLEGGPGGNLFESLSLAASSLVEPWLEERDVVVFEQRGTGGSEPVLSCPQYVERVIELAEAGATADEAEAVISTELLACRDALVEQGADLAAYNSIESAHDVEDIRQALSIDQWNVLGVSYGTRLAQTLMREHPESVRAAILDSVVPLRGNYLVDAPQHAQRSFDELFARCADDPACNARYPDLEQRFFAQVDALDAEPVEFDALDATDPTLPSYRLRASGDELVGLTFLALYDPSLFTQVPEMITELEAGDTAILSSLATVDLSSLRRISVAMQTSVTCNEELPFVAQQALSDAADIDRFGTLLEGEPLTGDAALEFCDAWGAGSADPVEEEPIVSDIPTLLLGGQFDPITPPIGMAEIAEGLTTSHAFTFDTLGHGVIVKECPQRIAEVFLDEPQRAPEGSCVASMTAPNFVFDSAEIEFEQRQVDVGEGHTVDTLVPAEWAALPLAGTFARGRSALDITSIAFLVDDGTVDPESYVALLAPAIGLGNEPEVVESREVGGRSWDLYQGSVTEPVDQAIEVAITEIEGTIVIVLLTTDPVERDELRETVFDAVLPGLTVF